MNNTGKVLPSLVDASLIKELLKERAMATQVPMTSSFLSSITMPSVYEPVKNFLYRYGFGLFIILVIVIYLWRRYIWYQKVKEENIIVQKEKFINPGQYVRQCNNDVQILQRPIPQYREADMNKEIRNMYLEKLDEKHLRCSQSLPTQVRVSDLKYNDGKFNDDRLDNIYGQPIYPCYDNIYECPIDQASNKYDVSRITPLCGNVIGRNAIQTPLIPDDTKYQDFYDSNDM